MLYGIMNRYDGKVIFSLECESSKSCVEAAVKSGIKQKIAMRDKL